MDDQFGGRTDDDLFADEFEPVADEETQVHTDPDPAPSGPGSDARTGSGANPRTKLTEAELAEKMEKMRILNEEKTRQFKRAEEDEQSHAMAMEKASAEQRKRRQEEAERRRREASDKRQLDDEREKNRQRKLNALGARESSWDEGKEERLLEEDRRRGTSNFRGANGGIRGSAGGRGGGLSGSRFADSTSDTDFMSGRAGRGGRGGRGRGGRGDYSGTPPPHGASQAAKKEPALTTEEFPALPSAPASNAKVSSVAKADLNSPTSPLGQWDDEMAAMDAKTATAAKP
ncbi:hypothetical protein UCDDA912_g02210 [Diaporthe ampelina]|uniref:Uncharacterized protein n=1 Tax=Diaporthe ampelina TaxID=1214573 RepID=A0A0G2IDP2_9PEZI|nr:hypothetical protein UCDDA912_g02210 [Diaporthe ampelina]